MRFMITEWICSLTLSRTWNEALVYHAFSYAFTTYCSYPHGHAVALTFPYFFKLNAPTRPELYDLTEIEPQTALDKMQKYTESIGLTNKGFGDNSLDNLLAKVNLQRLSNNPVEVTENEIGELKICIAI